MSMVGRMNTPHQKKKKKTLQTSTIILVEVEDIEAMSFS